MSEDDEAANLLADQGYTAELKAGKPGVDFDKLEEDLGPLTSKKKVSRTPQFVQKPPSMPSMPTGSVGYRQVENPYKVPSYLMNSAQYNEQISKLLGGLLSRNIRNNPIKLLV